MRLKRRQARRGGNVRLPILIAVVAVVVLSIGMLRLRSTVKTSPGSDVPSLTTESPSALHGRDTQALLLDSSAAETAPRDPRFELQQAEAAVGTARLEVANAHRAVYEAESLIARSERDLVDLEKFIEELEERGEDPVDHVDEGLERFTPAFEAYEIADEALERAQAAEAIEQIKLEGVEKRLMAVRRRLGTGS